MKWVKILEYVRRSGIVFTGLCLILFCFGLFEPKTFGWGVSMIFGLSAFSYARKHVVFITLLKLKNMLKYSIFSFTHGDKSTHYFIANKLKKLTDDVLDNWYINENDISFPYKEFQMGNLISKIENVQVISGTITDEIIEIKKEMENYINKIDEYLEKEERRFRWI